LISLYKDKLLFLYVVVNIQICSLFIMLFLYVYCRRNCIGGVMVSVLTSSVVDRGFEPLSGLTKDYKIGICCFSAKHAALRSYWLRIRIMCGVEWHVYPRTVVLVSWHYKNPTRRVGLEQSWPHHHLIEN
jgi:hypothetical protein